MSIELNQAVVPNTPLGTKNAKAQSAMPGFDGLLNGAVVTCAKSGEISQGAQSATQGNSAMPGIHSEGALLLMQLQSQPLPQSQPQPQQKHDLQSDQSEQVNMISGQLQADITSVDFASRLGVTPREANVGNDIAQVDVADAESNLAQRSTLAEPSEQLMPSKAVKTAYRPVAELAVAHSANPDKTLVNATGELQTPPKVNTLNPLETGPELKPKVLVESDDQTNKKAVNQLSVEQQIKPNLAPSQKQSERTVGEKNPTAYVAQSEQPASEGAPMPTTVVSVANAVPLAQSLSIANELVEWSSVASGRLSQQASVNRLDSAMVRINGGKSEVGVALKSTERSLLQKPQPIFVKGEQAAVMVNGMNALTTTQKNQLVKQASEATVSKNLGQFQAQILPHKVTYNEQLQKLYVRDYFLTAAQSDKLLATLAQGFGQLNNIQTIVLNGHTVYQSKGGQSWQ